MTSNELARRHQEQLLETMSEFFVRRNQVISDPVRDAFLEVPRHLFIDRYKTSAGQDWHEVTRDTLCQHMPMLYRDDGLGIFDDGQSLATISRPALVLYMLQMLQLDRGSSVFEVGAGSGWNAALMGTLVGPHGYVESVEVIPDLAARAKRAVERVGLSNVHIRCADGGDALGDGGAATAFDRVVVTTSAHDIPAGVRLRIRDGGLLLMVLRCPGGGDVLILFKRQSDMLLALESHPCEFVPMTGQGRRAEHEPVPVVDILESSGLRDKLAFKRPFFCGGRHAVDFVERTFPIRSFLAAVEPNFKPLLDPERGSAFALASPGGDSLAIVRNGEALCYGGRAAWDQLDRLMHAWLDLGMPTMLSMDLRAYPSGQFRTPLGERQWLMRRRDTDFLWSI